MPGTVNDVEPTPGIHATTKPVRVIYYTDPICSSCWGIEPQLRKLTLEYGDTVEIDYRMGGLLPDWRYNGGGISQPSDVAHHWDEASRYYDMPIDGNLWLEDPLNSSYPPSIAFKAAQMQDKEKATSFLREIREMVFMQKKNITKWEHIETAAKKVGLHVNQFKTAYNGKAKEFFIDDLNVGKELGVRGFPTLFFSNNEGKTELVYGSRPYQAYEYAVLTLAPFAQKNNYKKHWDALFAAYPTLTIKEFSVLSDISSMEAEKLLEALTEEGKLEKRTARNGAIWVLI